MLGTVVSKARAALVLGAVKVLRVARAGARLSVFRAERDFKQPIDTPPNTRILAHYVSTKEWQKGVPMLLDLRLHISG